MRRLRRSRQRAREDAELNITAFMNLMVVLIPFLLITTAFSRFSILDLYLPAAAPEQAKVLEKMQIEVVIRDDSIEVGDRNGGLIRRIRNTEAGYDFASLNEFLVQIKARNPAKRDIFILSEPHTSYEIMVQVMDTVRVTEAMDAGQLVQAELFPVISLGDAPPQPGKRTANRGGKAS